MFGLLCITNANTQCGQITNPPEQVLGEIGWNCTFTRNSLYSKTLQRMWNCEIDFRLFKVKKSIIGIHYLSTRRRWRVPRHNPLFCDVRHVTSYLDAANLIASFNAFLTRLYFLSANYRKWDVNVWGLNHWGRHFKDACSVPSRCLWRRWCSELPC